LDFPPLFPIAYGSHGSEIQTQRKAEKGRQGGSGEGQGQARGGQTQKDDRAEPFILQLSDLYRQLLGKNTSQTVTLDEELEFLRSYIYMLQARFESLLHIDIDIWPDSMNRKIPAFSLQLLVENCIKHNIISSARPLYIRIFQQQEDSIIIENNLQTKPSADESSGIGLDNLHKRYELLQIHAGVTIQKTDTKFSVTLQLLQP